MEANPMPEQAEQDLFYASLKRIAKDRGFKPGWICHTFKARFGEWPDYSMRMDSQSFRMAKVALPEVLEFVEKLRREWKASKDHKTEAENAPDNDNVIAFPGRRGGGPGQARG